MDEIKSKLQELNVGSWHYVESIHKETSKLQNRSGVYALISDEKVMYVGCSTAISRRLSGHYTISLLKFRGLSVRILYCYIDHNYTEVERCMMRMFAPPLNRHHNTWNNLKPFK